MKPVDQTEFGDKNGNCFPACLATLLELPVEAVPNFCKGDPEDWYAHVQAWLRPMGYSAVDLRLWVKGSDWRPNPGQLCILSGKSPRGDFDHSVVGIFANPHFRVLHDPHPSRAGIDGEFKEATFLICMDPAPSAQVCSFLQPDGTCQPVQERARKLEAALEAARNCAAVRVGPWACPVLPDAEELESAGEEHGPMCVCGHPHHVHPVGASSCSDYDGRCVLCDCLAFERRS